MSNSPSLKYKIDVTPYSGVAICRECGTRFFVRTREMALRMLDEHCTTTHPGYANTPLYALRVVLRKAVA